MSVCRVDILFMMFLQSPAAVAVFLTRTAVDVVCTAAVTGSARQESSARETAATGPVVGHQRCGVCYFTDVVICGGDPTTSHLQTRGKVELPNLV